MIGRAFAYVALTSTLLSACGGGGGGGGAAAGGGQPPLAVDVGHARRQNIATYLRLDGQIAPLQESVLSLQQSGTVTSVTANEGDRVSGGQLLAKIDDSTYRAQLTQAQAQVAQAQAALAGSTLTSPITAQQLGSAATQAEQQLLTTRNTLASAQAAMRTAKIQFDSDRSLESQGYVSSTTLEQQRSNYVAAQQQVNSAQNAIALQQSAVSEAKRNTAQTGVQQTDVASKRGALDAANANVKLLETEIGQTTLYAPYDGVITQRLLDPGAYASPNQAIVRISEIDHVYVNANVPDEDLGFVKAGTRATFTSPSLPGRSFTGTVYDVNATPTSGTLSYRARLRQANPDDHLRGGMLVTLQIRKESHPSAIVVPRTAIFEGDSGSNVFTVASSGKGTSVARAIPVSVGIQTDTLTEVRGAGIGPGTAVIVTRPDALMNGSTVAVSGPPKAAAGAAGAH